MLMETKSARQSGKIFSHFIVPILGRFRKWLWNVIVLSLGIKNRFEYNVDDRVVST
jgi:hypothetical protein